MGGGRGEGREGKVEGVEGRKGRGRGEGGERARKGRKGRGRGEGGERGFSQANGQYIIPLNFIHIYIECEVRTFNNIIYIFSFIFVLTMHAYNMFMFGLYNLCARTVYRYAAIYNSI